MNSTGNDVLDALRKELERRRSEARSAQREVHAHGGNLNDARFYSGAASALAALQGWLDQEIASASLLGVTITLPAVRSTAWLDGQREAVVKAFQELHIAWLSAGHARDMDEEMDRLAVLLGLDPLTLQPSNGADERPAPAQPR